MHLEGANFEYVGKVNQKDRMDLRRVYRGTVNHNSSLCFPCSLCGFRYGPLTPFAIWCMLFFKLFSTVLVS